MNILPPGVNIDSLVNDLRLISWEAANILLFYSKKISKRSSKKNIINLKNNNEPVTIADLEVNNLIIKNLKNKYPKIKWNILSEENTNDFIQSSSNFDWKWVLDPLDGTKDFIQGTENYAMHLALNYKNRPFLGVVLIPEKDELWISNGLKVWCENRSGIIHKINNSKQKKIEEMTLVISKNHRNINLKNLIEKLNFKKTIMMGSIGCKIASIIRGETDVYISLSLPGKSAPKDWDFAAPEIILKCAGGAITHLENDALSYNQENFLQEGIIVASSDNSTHKALCSQIKEIVDLNNILLS